MTQMRVPQSYFARGSPKERGVSSQETNRIYQARLLGYKRLTGASSGTQALRELGLSPSSASIMAVGQTAWETYSRRGIDTSPSSAELQSFYARYRSFYERPAKISFQSLSFASRAEAEQAFTRLESGTAWGKVSKQPVLEPTSLNPRELPDAVGGRLMTLPLRQPVLFQEKGVWSIGRALSRRPALPAPPFDQVKSRVKKDWLADQVTRGERKLILRLQDRFAKSSSCEGSCPSFR